MSYMVHTEGDGSSPQFACRMLNCAQQFSVSSADPERATRQQNLLRLAKAAIVHQQQQHPQQPGDFIHAHHADAWSGLIGHCVACAVLVTIPDGAKQRHCDSVPHRNAVSAAASTAAVSLGGSSTRRSTSKRPQLCATRTSAKRCKRASNASAGAAEELADGTVASAVPRLGSSASIAAAAPAAAAPELHPPVLSLQWSLDGHSATDRAIRAALDQLSPENLLGHIYFVAKSIRFRHRTPLLQCVHWTLSQLQRAIVAAAAPTAHNRPALLATAKAWSKLWFLLPCLLLLPDGGQGSRIQRIKRFHSGDLPELISSTLQVCDKLSVHCSRPRLSQPRTLKSSEPTDFWHKSGYV